VSVFLRWGVFGILGVAALLYAYNASKRLAEAHTARPATAAAVAEPAKDHDAALRVSPPAVAETPPAPARCEEELAVVQRAIDMRRHGDPLDRVMRIQEIAWQESAARRARLEQVATQWFNREGDIAPSTLRAVVVNDCQQHPSAP